MIDAFKFKTEWEENHMVGVHVRRGDLTIYGKNVSSCIEATAMTIIFRLIAAWQVLRQMHSSFGWPTASKHGLSVVEASSMIDRQNF